MKPKANVLGTMQVLVAAGLFFGSLIACNMAPEDGANSPEAISYYGSGGGSVVADSPSPTPGTPGAACLPSSDPCDCPPIPDDCPNAPPPPDPLPNPIPCPPGEIQVPCNCAGQGVACDGDPSTGMCCGPPVPGMAH